jgi:hypothetical protein
MGDQTELFMRDTDAFSWYLEHDPGPPLDHPRHRLARQVSPDFEVLTARLAHAGQQPGAEVPAACRSQPPGRLATPRWVDTDFDLARSTCTGSRHRAAHSGYGHRVRPDRGDERLRPVSRPLWQFTLVENLARG